MKKLIPSALAAAIAVSLAACGGGSADVPAAQTPRVDIALDDTSYATAVSATNDLGLDLLVGQGTAENVIISPASLTIALAMLAEGATGEGDAELTGLLGLSGTERTEAYSALVTALGSYQDGAFSLDEVPENPFLRVANNLVVNEGFEVKDTFSGALDEYFGAPLVTADLGSQSGKKVLDAWVKENTAGLIEESAIEPREDLRLVLQNALLFAAAWERAFLATDSYDADFVRADGSLVTAGYMNALLDVGYGEAGGYAAIELPYTSDFTAYFVLPPMDTAPTAEGIRSAIDAISRTDQVAIQLPTFDLEAETDVKEYLEGLGISALFEDPSALRGIAEADLVVSDIAQQARLIVDEDGTVGAAVTEIGVAETSAPMPQKEFRANRPFVMVVRHVETGIDLFTAHIADPAAE